MAGRGFIALLLALLYICRKGDYVVKLILVESHLPMQMPYKKLSPVQNDAK